MAKSKSRWFNFDPSSKHRSPGRYSRGMTTNRTNTSAHRRMKFEVLETRQMLTLTYYVDGPGGDGPGGDDSNNGLSLQTPFATIQRAANVAGAGNTVIIRGGTYREQVVQPRSGVGDSFPITYQAYNNEDVIVSGGDLVTGWTQHSGDIWKATVNYNANNDRENNTLFVNGEHKVQARKFADNDPFDINDWGQLENGLITEGATTIVLDELQGDPNGKWVGAQIKFHLSDWAFDTHTITAFNGATGTITLDGSIGQELQKQTNGFYLFDTYEALDKPGEWYKDNGNTLYYHAAPGEDPNNLEIEFKSRGYGFDVREKDSIRIDGITFRGVSIYANENSDNNTYENNVFYGYGKGPSNNFGRFYLTGDSNIFRGNEVYETYGGVFDLGGQENEVLNNYFHDIGFDGNSAVIGFGGEQQLIAYNTIRNFARHFADGYSVRSEYAYNEFEDGGRLSWDTGVFDADGQGGDSSFSVFHHNVFRNSNTRGTYAAFYGRNNNTVIHHNLIYDFTAPGQDTLPPYTTGGIDFRQGYHNTIIGAAPKGTGFFDIDQRDAVQTLYNNNLQVSLLEMNAIGVDARGSLNYSSSDFVDFNNDDFRLAASSDAIDSGIVISGINDGFSGAAPDAGALEFGESLWAVGHDFNTPPSVSYNWSFLPGMNLYTNPQFLEGIGDWTIVSGTPNAEDRDSWDLKEASLTGSSRTYSVEFAPGDAMSRTFTGLTPNTTYTLGANVRVTEEVVDRADQFDGSSGSISTGLYRNQYYVHELTPGEWVRFDNIDFGDAHQYDQIEIVHGRDASIGSLDGATVQIRLGSPTGQVIGEFSSLIDENFWYSAVDDLPAVSGTHSIYLSVSGTNSENVAVARVRLLKERPPELDKLTVAVSLPASPEVVANFGKAMWDGNAYETIRFSTGPSDTSATLTFTNNGRISTYLDKMYLVEGDVASNNDLAELYGVATQSSTFSNQDASLAIDGDLSSYSRTQDIANSWWQMEFAGDVLIGEIELVNQNNTSFGDLSNFTVSVWDGDPDAGGVKKWDKAYFSSGSVGIASTFRISGSEIGDDGETRLATALGSHIRVQLNGLNNNGNGNLGFADFNVVLASEAPAIENVARRGEASESTDFYETFRLADWAIDGDIGSFSHTDFETGWWQVELPDTTSIDQLVVLNTSRFGPFRLSVWATDPELGGFALWTKDYNVGEDEILTVNGWETSSGNRLDSFSITRYFRIDRLNNGFLALDEVQVWANSTTVGGVPPTTVDINATSYEYDFGTLSSPVENGYEAITPATFGDISWTNPVQATDRGASANDLDRDFVTLNADGTTLRHRIANGTWEVTLRMGDAAAARDNMIVRAEGELINDDIDAALGAYTSVGLSGTPDQSFVVNVTDGFLDLEFHDNGGDTSWVVNSLMLTKLGVPSIVQVEVDTVTGHTLIHNPTVVPFELDGYTIVSATNSLRDDTWASLADQGLDGGSWVELLASSGALAEVSTTGSITIAPGEKLWLGPLYDVAQPQMLVFEYTVSGIGEVPVELPVEFGVFANPADFNFDGSVDDNDLAKWQGDYGQNGGSDADSDGFSTGLDFLAWQRSFGQSAVASASSPASTAQHTGANLGPNDQVSPELEEFQSEENFSSVAFESRPIVVDSRMPGAVVPLQHTGEMLLTSFVSLPKTVSPRKPIADSLNDVFTEFGYEHPYSHASAQFEPSSTRLTLVGAAITQRSVVENSEVITNSDLDSLFSASDDWWNSL